MKKESLYQIITEVYGVKITKARRTIEAIGAQDEIAEYLDIEEGTPIILFRCITYGIVNEEKFRSRISNAIIEQINLNSILIR